MSNAMGYSLFFVIQDPHYAEGTLLELEEKVVSAASLDPTFGQAFNTIPDSHYEAIGYRLPDRGDGISGLYQSTR